MSPKHPGTNADRDFRKPMTPPPGVPVLADDWDEEATGKYDGDELREARERRTPLARLRHLEEKNDARDKADAERDKLLRETREEVIGMRGELKVLPRLVDILEKTNERAAQREMLTVTAKVEVDKAEGLDNVAAKGDRRRLVAQIVGAIIAGGAIGKLMHMAGLW